MLLLLFSSFAGVYMAWSLVCLEINYKRALSMKIPLVRVPIDPLNVLFQVFEPHVWRFLDLLPFEKPESVRYMRRGWFFQDKAFSFEKYGPVWAFVTPRDVHVYVCDPEANFEVFWRKGDFIRPTKIYKLLEVYGPCISTADNTNWPRHRKVLASPFNENIMDFVWRESINQTHEMIDFWTRKHSQSGIKSVAKDTRTLSLNVLAATGFRRSQNFRGSSEDAGENEGRLLSYRDALQTVLDNAILLMLIPPRFLLGPWVPSSMHQIGRAAADFKKHMVRMLEQETEAFNRGEGGSGGLMTSFVRALHAHNPDDTSRGPKGLSVEEIFGNIFVINFAGHDTTANTLSFSMLLLAAFPEVQEWVAVEVLNISATLDDEKWDYRYLFPRLLRCRAVLLETLRLFPPIMSLPKWTNEQPQSLRIGDRIIILPPLTGINPGILATHTHPKYWSDPLLWKPSRWIQSKSPGTIQNDSISEEIFTPLKGSFMPWSDGQQSCPGKNFSQVEFVAVLAYLLYKHRLRVARLADESTESMRRRVLDVVNDCDAQLLLRMKDSDRVRIFCEPVE